jgi:hypothetical protein
VWKFRVLSGALFASFVCALALYLGGAQYDNTPKPPEYQPLEDHLALYLAGGWQLHQSPTMPGPFRLHGASHQASPKDSGSVTYRNANGQLKYSFGPPRRFEILVIPLETEDGQLTVVVLKLEPKQSK